MRALAWRRTRAQLAPARTRAPGRAPPRRRRPLPASGTRDERSSLLARVPGRDGLDLLVREPLRDPVHHGAGPRAGAEVLHRLDDRRAIEPSEPGYGRLHTRRGRVTAR